jgi:outer membrane lipoprotein carrier protein
MRTIRILGLVTLLFASNAFAGAREQLNAFTRGLQGLDGRFEQQVFDASGKRKETSSGRIALSAPRLFRWEYMRPYPQLIVADGTTVWVHDPDLKQVTKRAQGAEEQDSPLAALIDPARLDRDYLVTEAPARDGLQWLQLTPRAQQEAGFASASLGFGRSGLERMQLVDTLGQRTEIRFSDWRRNPAFKRGTFRFTPPRGVDVVGD